jgi:UDP-glucose:(heptosyl)LPS alpha-1,3-glucosyltransferase
MKLAFCLFKYFPFGGLQRDFIRIAMACQKRGHSIHVFTMAWEGAVPPEFEVTVITPKNWTNHRRCSAFSKKVNAHLSKEHFDAVIGFNRIMGLDIYFAADPCYKNAVFTERHWLYRLTARYRHYKALERAVFSPEAHTHIFLLTAAEQKKFIQHYATPEQRFHLLPPGIESDRRAPSDISERRAALREKLSISEKEKILLFIASRFKTKGLDRALHALATLPKELLDNTLLLVIGDDTEKPYRALIKQLRLTQHVKFLGARDDIPDFLFAADALVHPAYREAAGMVLLEALVAGLPVLTTANCGYAFHIALAKAGLLISEPFHQRELNEKLCEIITSPQRIEWKTNALEYAERTDLFSLPEKAALSIENIAKTLASEKR